jgi:hypothetical protein
MTPYGISIHVVRWAIAGLAVLTFVSATVVRAAGHDITPAAAAERLGVDLSADSSNTAAPAARLASLRVVSLPGLRIARRTHRSRSAGRAATRTIASAPVLVRSTPSTPVTPAVPAPVTRPTTTPVRVPAVAAPKPPSKPAPARERGTVFDSSG